MTTLTANTIGTASSIGVDMAAWDLTPLQTGEIVAMSGTSVTIDVGDHQYVLTGHDFAFAIEGGELRLDAGTITGITYGPEVSDPTFAPVFDYTIEDFSLDVHDFNAFVADNDVAGYKRALFSGDDTLTGGPGQDHLLGGKGNDHISGEQGADVLEGGTGDDVLVGGPGADYLIGGGGSDSFVFLGEPVPTVTLGAHDMIQNFNTGQDHIVVAHGVTGIDAAVDGGATDSFHIDQALAAALDAAHLGANHAAVATLEVEIGPPGGDAPAPIILETFIVVDQNGVAGYQAGQDLAIRILAPHLADLSTDDFISPILADV